MEDFSILIGGIAGDGINEAGLTAARLMNRLGYQAGTTSRWSEPHPRGSASAEMR